MRRILFSLATIVFLGAVVVGATGAFFSDEETSTGNVFAAGALDLKVDSVAHYNGLVCFDEQWVPESEVEWNPEIPGLEEAEGANIDEAIEEYKEANPAANPTAGDECFGTWELTDLGPEHRFFDFDDLKPGDNGENTLSLHVFDNDAYMCTAIHNVESNDNGCTEPEEEDGDVTCGDPGEGEGELDQELNFFVWEDDGDNIYEPNEDGEILVEGANGQGIEGVYPLYTPGNGVFVGGETAYLGVYWCYGDFAMVDDELTCDGGPVTNLSQSDSLVADITFYVEQARNNGEFICPDIDEFNDDDDQEERQTVGAALDEYVAPSCDVEVSGDSELTSALAVATVGQTLCLDDLDGVYSGPITLSVEDLTIAGIGSPTISGGVIIDAPGVTVTGFEILPGNTEGSTAAVYLKEAADGATVSYNVIDSTGVTISRGIVNVIGTDLPGVTISNNEFVGPNDGTSSGIYTNPHTGLWTISNNDFSGWLAGIGQWNGADVLNNEFTGGGEAIGVDSAWEAVGGVVNFNNFLDDSRFNTYGAISGTIDAENNFFGPNGGDAQVDDQGATVNVDYTPEEVSPFPHN